MDNDVAAAVEWLAARRDVDRAKMGLVGVSMGAEVAVRVAARRGDVRATVAEGLNGGAEDARAAGASWAALAQLYVLGAVGTLLTGESAGSDADFVARIGRRPLMLISAGRGVEADTNRVFARRAGAATEHWNLPDAPHASALRIDPQGYERRVIAFLDRALSVPPAPGR